MTASEKQDIAVKYETIDVEVLWSISLGIHDDCNFNKSERTGW
jgi:hypothetical protein